VANAGDCKAVFGRKVLDENGSYQWKSCALSSPHTAKTEQELIMKQHPNEPDAVSQGRVKGYLEPSRGIGDALFKDKYFNKCLLPEAQLPEPFTPPYTTALPEVESFQINSVEEKDSFLIIASDGLWDMLSDQQAVDIVANSIGSKDNASTALLKRTLEMTSFEGTTLQEKITNSLKLAPKLRRHFYDDTTILVIFFQPNDAASMLDANCLPKIPTQSSCPPASFVQITEKLHDYLPPHNSSPS